MRCSIDSLLIAVRRAFAAAGCAAFVITGIATSAELDGGPVTVPGEDRPAHDAIANLVAFLEYPEGGGRAPNHAPQPNQGEQVGPPGGWGGPSAPGQGGAIVLPPKVAVYSFDVEVGADGTVKQGSGGTAGFTLDSIEGLGGLIAQHVRSMQGPPPPVMPPQPQPPQPQPTQQGPQHPGQPHPQFQAPLPPNHRAPFPAPAIAPVPFDAHAHVAQQLDQILGKLDRLEARLGGPGPQGRPPMGQLPHGGPRQSGPFRSGPAPQFHGRVVHPGHQAPSHGSLPQDELNRRFGEHSRELHRHVEEMARGLGEKLKAHGGMAEEFQKHHQKIVQAHEQINERFQDIRRRFAEQQERIERLEQEVRRLHEEHGNARPERERKKGERGDREKQGATSRDSETPQVSFDAEDDASL